MQYLCYTMQAGDTLQNIANTYQVGVNELIAANPQIVTQPVVCPGTVIAIPYYIPMQPPCTTQPTPLPAPAPTPPSPPLPEPAPMPTPETAPTEEQITQMEDQVVDLVNHVRAERELQPLTINRALGSVARAKAEDMVANNYFGHISPTYGGPFEMLQAFGIPYTAAGENIAKGPTTPQGAMDLLMSSLAHATNILNTMFTEIGVGYAFNGGEPIWTQLFIRP